MPDLDSTPSANRSVELELQDERRLLLEGYELLDEKRMLLASEMLRRLALHRRLLDDWRQRYDLARRALAEAMAALGIDGLELYPVAARNCVLETVPQRIAGIAIERLGAIRLEPSANPAPPAVWPSAAVDACGAAFVDIVELAANIALEERNLRRLAREYQRTDRRARALENVLLPELDAVLRSVQEQLEYFDTEEAVRVHTAHRRIESQQGEPYGEPR
jgi:V/A-type H+-transporting ATPase subunit D